MVYIDLEGVPRRQEPTLDLGDEASTHDEVVQALTSPNTTWDADFLIYSERGSAVGTLENVTTANVNLNTDQAIKRTLDLTWTEDHDFDDFHTGNLEPFRNYIQPRVHVNVDATRTRTWALGMFLYTEPSRVLTDGIRHEHGATFMEAGTFWLQSLRPYYGWGGARGMTVAAAIQFVLSRRIGNLFGDPIMPDGDEGGEIAEVTWTSDDTFLGVVNQLCATAGWYSIFYNGDGVAVVKPQPDDFTKVYPVWFYTASDESLVITNPAYLPSLDNISNRVQVRASNASTEKPMSVIVELDDVVPGHPWARSVIGHCLDAAPVDDSNATKEKQLLKRARNIMNEQAQRYERMELETRAMPFHSGYDVVGFSFTGDEEGAFTDMAKWQERGWTLDLMTFRQKHVWSRIRPIGRAPSDELEG
tara:strand:+ start:8849 stop:10099 length:1251 start_codon:yes stop_codon:yes gene_type:complete